MNRPKFSKALFWDVDIARTNFEQYASFIIGRVLELGSVADFRELERLYGRERIRAAARQHKFIDPRDVRFWGLVLDIPLTDFVCMKKPFLQLPSAFLAR